MDAVDFRNRKAVIGRIVERLGTAPSDFNEKLNGIDWGKPSGKTAAAAILLPLVFSADGEGFTLSLIKRSSSVPQGGDISCPGGIVEPLRDRVSGRILSWLFPLFCHPRAVPHVKRRGLLFFRNLSLLLAGGLRESREEVGLHPLRVSLLGTLPCYSLLMFTRTMFPLVGRVRGNPSFRTNWEVEKIVPVPLESLFREENYGLCLVESRMTLPSHPGRQNWEFPCFICGGKEGTEDILWGATFYVVMSFLKIVFGFDYTDLRPERRVRKELRTEYVTGGNLPGRRG